MVENEEVIQTNKKDKLYWFKLISGLTIFVSLFILIGIRISNPEFSLVYPLIIWGFIAFLWTLQFLAKRIANAVKNKTDPEKVPDPITKDEVFRLIYQTIQGTKEHDYKDGYFRNINGFGEVRSYHINKNLIYLVKLILSYKIDFGNVQMDECWIVLNATYPKIRPAILPTNSTEYRIKEVINSISSNPREEPDEEKRIETDLSTGKQIVHKKRIHKRKKEEPKKEEGVI